MSITRTRSIGAVNVREAAPAIPPMTSCFSGSRGLVTTRSHEEPIQHQAAFSRSWAEGRRSKYCLNSL